MNVFDLWAHLGLNKDDYDKGLGDAKKNADGFASKIGTGVAKAAKVGVAGISAIAGATATLTGLSVKSYASYEQLVGGVETLFGKSADLIEQYAQRAYQTAGLSANDYMETVTGFSASLLQSLDGDTKKAAEYADRAVQDMSDNANKMGTDITSIQWAYSGFAKSNYTMLDNLKLGYGGTQEEMKRLIKDASEMTDVQEKLGVTVDSSSMSFGNVVNAISVMQESMGIAGTTAKEAATTIEGSCNSMKSAWQNVLTGFADENQDIGSLLETAIVATQTYANNIVPRISQALTGIGQAFDVVIPEIAQRLPEAVGQLAPGLAAAVIGLLSNVGSAVVSYAPSMISSVFDAIPAMLSQGTSIAAEIMNNIAQGLPDGIPAMLEQVLPMLTTLSESLRENAGVLVDGALNLIVALGEGLINSIPVLIEYVPTIITNLAGIINDNAPKMFAAAAKLIVKLALGLVKSIPTLVRNVPKIITAIVSVITAFNWISLGSRVIKFFGNGIKNMAGNVASAFKSSVKDGISYLKSLPGKALKWGKDMIQNFIDGICAKVDAAVDTVSSFASKIASYIHFSVPDVGPLSDADEYGGDFVDLISGGIDKNVGRAEKSVRNMASRMSVAARENGDVWASSARGGDDLSLLVALLNKYLPEIARGMQLDGRQVSRALVGYMDDDLGSRTRQRARAN